MQRARQIRQTRHEVLQNPSQNLSLNTQNQSQYYPKSQDLIDILKKHCQRLKSLSFSNKNKSPRYKNSLQHYPDIKIIDQNKPKLNYKKERIILENKKYCFLKVKGECQFLKKNKKKIQIDKQFTLPGIRQYKNRLIIILNKEEEKIFFQIKVIQDYIIILEHIIPQFETFRSTQHQQLYPLQPKNQQAPDNWRIDFF